MKKSFLLIVPVLLVLSGCNRDRLDINVSSVKTEPLQVLRLEDDLFKLNATNFDNVSTGIKARYGIRYEHYLMSLNRSSTADPTYKPAILSFTQDQDVRGAYGSVKKLYPEGKMKALLPEINDVVKHFHYYFPKRPLPTKLMTCLTGWNYSFAYMDSTFFLGLDMYMGDTSVYYSMLRYPYYQTRCMNSNYIVPDIARGWMLSEFDNSQAPAVLLNHTIFWGKIYYAVNALLPDAQDSLLIGYTSKQIRYCKEYERKLWGYFAEKNRLYESNAQLVRELTTEGPFTGAISKECPPRIAMWVGWQIVKSYMDHNEKVTLDELMHEKDVQKILNKSKYRP